MRSFPELFGVLADDLDAASDGGFISIADDGLKGGKQMEQAVVHVYRQVQFAEVERLLQSFRFAISPPAAMLRP
jgi:hypothetical protein